METITAETADKLLAAENDHERMVRVYVKIRDRRAELKREFEDQDASLQSQQDTIKRALMESMQRLNMDQIGTKAGTVYKDMTIKASCDDWDLLYSHMAETGDFGLLEKRISRNRVKEYMDANEGRLPPGVSVFKEVDIKVRRK